MLIVMIVLTLVVLLVSLILGLYTKLKMGCGQSKLVERSLAPPEEIVIIEAGDQLMDLASDRSGNGWVELDTGPRQDQEGDSDTAQVSSSHTSQLQEDVLMFPDPEVPCQSFYDEITNCQGFKIQRGRCMGPSCRYMHELDTNFNSSLIKVFRYLQSAERQIDICIYLITFGPLANFLIYLKTDRNINIRIISGGDSNRPESSPMSSYSSQATRKLADKIALLKANRIEVRQYRGEGKLNQKFFIIDKSKLLSGSFNWTYMSITKSLDDLIATSHDKIVDQYNSRFESIWVTSRSM